MLWSLWATILALGFAFVTSGFAHDITTPSEQARITYAATLGVAVESICAESEQKKHRQADCQACLIGQFLILTQAASPAALSTVTSRAAWSIQDLGPLPRVGSDDANPSRGPPVRSTGAHAG